MLVFGQHLLYIQRFTYPITKHKSLCSCMWACVCCWNICTCIYRWIKPNKNIWKIQVTTNSCAAFLHRSAYQIVGRYASTGIQTQWIMTFIMSRPHTIFSSENWHCKHVCCSLPFCSETTMTAYWWLFDKYSPHLNWLTLNKSVKNNFVI